MAIIMRLWFILPIVIVAILIAFNISLPAAPRPYGATVFIQRGEMSASGVYIGHGFVLTAAHVADYVPPTEKHKKPPDFTISGATKAQLLWSDPDKEIALFLVEGFNGPIADLACGHVDPSIGDDIEAVGNPLGFRDLHTYGKVAQNVGTRTIGTPQTDFIVNATVLPGMSGGPVFDKYGVAGIVSATETAGLGTPIPVGFIIPRSVICSALKARYGQN